MRTRSYQRKPNQLRPVEIIRHYTRYAPGSVLIRYGETQVLVTATIEERVPRHIHLAKEEHAGWLTAEYSMLPGATQTRNNRERVKVSGRTNEIQRLIGRSLRAAVDLSNLGARTITIDADVLQADGGTRVASITGGYVALMDALNYLELHEKLPGEKPLLSPVASVSVGVVEGEVVLDLDYDEDSQAEVDANVVMNGDGHIIEMQATSEKIPFSRQTMETMMDLATGGIQELIALQAEALKAPYNGPREADLLETSV
jgi:ribonuclease PH